MCQLVQCGALLLVLTIGTTSASDQLDLGDSGKRWLVVASSKDLDTAIGIAGYYGLARARVVSSKSGWYAIVLGPYSGGIVKDVQASNPEIADLPKDARLSQGSNFLQQLWQESPEQMQPMSEYGPGKPAQFQSGQIRFEVRMAGSLEDPGGTEARAFDGEATVFSFSTPADYEVIGAEVGLVNLDTSASSPQLVFTRYTGGAHCCTQTWIATQPAGSAGWTLVDAGLLDGGGFGFEDVDGDGALELLHADNSFLYAFDSYAGSFAPIKIRQLRGGKLIDVSNEPGMRPLLKRNLARMEFAAKLDGSLWRTNGFLTGWMAAKQRLGQGEEAWQVVSENFDAASDFGPQVCRNGKPVESCDFPDLEKVPYLKALAQFLQQSDYGALPDAAVAQLK